MTRWLPWPRDPRYLVSDDGAALDPAGNPMTPNLTYDGYPRFRYLDVAGEVKHPRLHVMVCETFHGPRPPGKEAAHDNGTPSDCRASNLAWKTPAENCADRVRHGTAPRGERHGRAILTAAQVIEIRDSAEPVIAFVRRFGVGWSTIKDARTGRSWGSL